MAKRKSQDIHLVSEYIENLRREILQKYRRQITNYSKNRNGIYALYRKGQLYYVGLASSLSGRLNAHLKDRHNGKWDTFSMYLTPDSSFLRELESLILRIVTPEGNKTKGKLKGADDLIKHLERDLREHVRIELEYLTGRRETKRQKVSVRHIKEHQTDLVGYGLQSLSILSSFKGKLYKGRINRDGWVCFGKKEYPSLSAAASAITGRPMNGWIFWKYKDKKGKWQIIDNLR